MAQRHFFLKPTSLARALTAALAALLLAACQGPAAPSAGPATALENMSEGCSVTPGGARRCMTLRGLSKVPRRIAIAPAIWPDGLSDKPDDRDVQIAYADLVTRQLLNALTTSDYQSVTLGATLDWMLANEHDPRNRLAPAQLGPMARDLGVDAIMQVSVDDAREINLLIAGSIETQITGRLYDRSGQLLYTVTKRQGSGSANVPVSLISIALASIKTQAFFSDKNRLTNIFNLVYDFVQAMPRPSDSDHRRRRINYAVHSAIESPVRADQTLWMAVETRERMRLVAEIAPERTVALAEAGSDRICATAPPERFSTVINAAEQQTGRYVYVGCYRPHAGDNIADRAIIYRGFDAFGDRFEYEDFANPVTIDTVAPPSPARLNARYDGGSILLNWPALEATEDLRGYEVSRSDTPLSGFMPIDIVETTQYRDTEPLAQTGYYQIAAIDRAGNRSSPTPVEAVTPVTTGPTPMAGAIVAPTVWYAAASPYVISDDLIVERGARLEIEPGTRIEAVKGAGLTIRGELSAQGRADGIIRFDGVAEQGTAARWRGLTFAAGSVGEISYGHFRHAETAIDILDAEPVIRLSRFTDNQTAILSRDFSFAQIEDNALRGNDVAIKVARSEPFIVGNDIRFNARAGVEIIEAVPNLRRNLIAGNRKLDVRVDQRGVVAIVDLGGNCWGTDDPSAIWAGIDGPVAIPTMLTDCEGEDARSISVPARATGNQQVPGTSRQIRADCTTMTGRQRDAALEDGYRLMQGSDHAAALARLEPQLGCHENDPDLHHRVAALRYIAKDYQGALIAIERALALRPGSFDYLNNAARIRIAAGDRSGAVADMRRALALRPDNISLRAQIRALER